LRISENKNSEKYESLKKLKSSFEFEFQHITETDFEFDDV